MHFSNSFLALVAALQFTTAAPVDEATVQPRLQKGFSTSQQYTGRTITRNGAADIRKALLKFGGNVHSDLATAAAAPKSVITTPQQYDKEYLTPVTLGSKVLMLDIDSGSSDLWAFSSLQSASDRGSHAFYQATASKRLQGSSWQIAYGDSSMAEGYVYTDKVTCGGVTAASQAVEAATQVSAQFTQDTNNDGIFGFGFNSINQVSPNKQTTWFDKVKGTLPKPLWAADLKKGAPGRYDFGFINTTSYNGDLAWRPVDTANGVWQMHAGGYYVGNTKHSNGPETFNAIVDTGTSVILLKDADVTNYYNQVQGAQYSAQVGGVVFPCTSTLPDLTFIIDSKMRRVPGSYIKYINGGNNACLGGVQSNGGLPFAILGDVFIKSQYVVFDTSVPRIGFGQKV